MLAGDHKQLEATVKSEEAAKKGLSLSFSPLVSLFLTFTGSASTVSVSISLRL